jgi:transposase
MNASIHFTRPTVKMLIRHLKQAYDAGNLRLVRHISALFDLARSASIAQAAETHSIMRQTVYNWFKAFLVEGENSLVYRRPTGRKPHLTKTQRKRLVELVTAGPQAAGFSTGCWTSLLIQQLIQREFGVLYNRYYVCELLRTLGFSVQKAWFVSDHLDEEARQCWWMNT